MLDHVLFPQHLAPIPLNSVVFTRTLKPTMQQTFFEMNHQQSRWILIFGSEGAVIQKFDEV